MLVAGSAAAQRAKRVGIVVSVQVNVTAEEGRALATALGRAVRDAFDIDVIAGDETERRLPPGGLPDECVAKAECRNDLGRRLDADELLLLVVVRLGEEIQIDSTWAHVASGDTASRPRVTLKNNDDRDKVFAEAAPQLLPHTMTPDRGSTGPNIVLVPQSPPSQPERRISLGTWIAGGTSAAALVGASLFAISARQKFNALDADGCRNTVCDEARIDSLGQRALAADILWGVSAAAAVTSIVFYFTSESTAAPTDERPTVTISPGPGSVGLVVGGHF